jgi:hypothetical protein
MFLLLATKKNKFNIVCMSINCTVFLEEFKTSFLGHM